MSHAIALTPLRERLADITDALIVGVWPPLGCRDCGPDGWCGPCAAMDADRDLLNRTILPAIQSADSDAEALAHFISGFMDLTGASAGDLLRAVRMAHMMRAHGADAGDLVREMEEMAAVAAGTAVLTGGAK